MTISYVGLGGTSSTTSSISPSYPSGILAGDLLVLSISYKYGGTASVSTPSGWTAPANNADQGGTGTGSDTGVGAAIVFYRIADGSETGSVSVTVTSGNSTTGKITQYRSDKPRNVWSIACSSGSDSTSGTDWSVTAGADPGMAAGDFVVTTTGSNSDGYSLSGATLTQTGVTYSAPTEPHDAGYAGGDDIRLVIDYFEVATGTSSAAPVFTGTFSGSSANAPRGATIILRIRDTSGSALDVTEHQTEAFAAVVGDGGAARSAMMESFAAIISDGGTSRVAIVEVFVARSANQALLGSTSLDFETAFGDDGAVDSGLSLTGVTSLDFGFDFGDDGALGTYITGSAGISFGMTTNLNGAIESVVVNEQVLYRVALDAHAPSGPKIKPVPLWRQVDRMPLPYSVVIEDGVARRVRIVQANIDPDNAFVGGHEYTMLDNDPRYEILVAAGVVMEEIG